jgi:hypothetical protein
MTAAEQWATDANKLGAKLWKRAKDAGLGIRILSAKQLAKLSSDEMTLIRSGWISWAYCDYGADLTSSKFGELWIVKK